MPSNPFPANFCYRDQDRLQSLRMSEPKQQSVRMFLACVLQFDLNSLIWITCRHLGSKTCQLLRDGFADAFSASGNKSLLTV